MSSYNNMDKYINSYHDYCHQCNFIDNKNISNYILDSRNIHYTSNNEYENQIYDIYNH